MATVFCKTDHAILVMAVPDKRGVLHFPSTEGAPLPGVMVDVKALMPIHEQLKIAAGAVVGRDVARELKIWDDLADEVPMPNGGVATMYVGSLGGEVSGADKWPVMPAILRALPKTRIRLPYLRAWQVLQGGLQLNTKAVDPEELKKYFDD